MAEIDLGLDIGALGSSVLGMAYDQATQGQQMANQEQLMALGLQNELELQTNQFGLQQALNQQGHDLQYDMWNKTNYKAQVEHMKKAGLNVGLMNKQAGPVGTTGSQTGGQAQKGSPSVPQAPLAPKFELYGLQAKLMQEQAEDLESQRNKRDGADTEETKSRTALNEQKSKVARLYEHVILCGIFVYVYALAFPLFYL